VGDKSHGMRSGVGFGGYLGGGEGRRRSGGQQGGAWTQGVSRRRHSHDASGGFLKKEDFQIKQKLKERKRREKNKV
jgi:hypothetical protein